MRNIRRCWAALFVAFALLSAAPAAPQTNDLEALDQQMGGLYRAGKYAEALDAGKRALSLAEHRLGARHPYVGLLMSRVALFYVQQGQVAEAEVLYKRGLEILISTQGSEHLVVATALGNLGALYYRLSRYAEAEPLFKRSIAILEKQGRDTLELGEWISNLAMLYDAQARFAEAEPLHKRGLAIFENALGPDNANFAKALGALAAHYDNRGRFLEAEPVYKHAIAIFEKALGSDHPEVALWVENLAGLYSRLDRYAEAEVLTKRALEIWQKTYGPNDTHVGVSFSHLSSLYDNTGRQADAEPLAKRGLAIVEKTLGPNHPDTAMAVQHLAIIDLHLGRTTEAEGLLKRVLAIREKIEGAGNRGYADVLGALAHLYANQGRFAEAEPLLKRALEIQEKLLGPRHTDTGETLGSLGSIYFHQERFAEAEPLLKRILEIFEKNLGPNNPSVAGAWLNLAGFYDYQGLESEAETMNERSAASYEKGLGADNPLLGVPLNNLASLHLRRSDWPGAVEYWRRSADIIIRRNQRSLSTGSQTRNVNGNREAEEHGNRFLGLVKAAYRLKNAGSQGDSRLPREMFEMAQWARGSEAAASLAQMATRAAKGDQSLSAIVRERQDLAGEWQKRDEARTAALSRSPELRNKAAETANEARLLSIESRIGEIDKRLASEYPDFFALANPSPSAVEDVQNELGSDEALILFLDTPKASPTLEETFIWVVTRTDLRWVRSDMGTAALTREVAALRCGLDDEAWEGPRCKELTGQDYSSADRNVGKPLPFDHARAHKLYRALFGQAEDLIRGKDLLLVASGPLTQLPFQVLVTAPPADGDDKSAAWLIRDHALTVLPAVSSLKALRRVGRPSSAAKPMIGFGNPLLDGPNGAYADLARTRAPHHDLCRHLESAGRVCRRTTRCSASPDAGRIRRWLLSAQAGAAARNRG